MRDPARIPRVLEKIRAYWEANPDLRLGQIIDNLASSGEDYVFYMEDDALEARIPAVPKSTP